MDIETAEFLIDQYKEKLCGIDISGAKDYILPTLELALALLEAAKPNDRSGMDRRTAIIITDLEKLIAYVEKYISR